MNECAASSFGLMKIFHSNGDDLLQRKIRSIKHITKVYAQYERVSVQDNYYIAISNTDRENEEKKIIT